jgi:pyruvate dehydrogenase E1 component
MSKPIDSDPQESAEWHDALASVMQAAGPRRVREIMDLLAAAARDPSIGWQPVRDSPCSEAPAALHQGRKAVLRGTARSS